MNGFLSIVLLAALGYGGLAGLLYLMQPRLLYYPNMPTRELMATPTQTGLDYEAVTLHTDDGVRLSAWFIPHPVPRATLLFLHGNAGNLSHRLESIRLFHDLGLAVFIIDYRGYGQSEGRPSEAGTYRDAAAAWDYLIGERHLAAHEIVIFGRSSNRPSLRCRTWRHGSTPGCRCAGSAATAMTRRGPWRRSPARY